MTELRDARLRKALEEAPDAQLRPPARSREAILAAAHEGVRPAWRRWWGSGTRSGTPWAAAFATLALATLVIVMWEGQEVPGPAAEEQVAAAPRAEIPAPAPAPAPQPAVQPAPALAPAPAAAPAPATARAPAAPTAPSARTVPAPRMTPAPAPVPQPGPAPAAGVAPAPLPAPATAPEPQLPDAAADALAKVAPSESRVAAAPPPPAAAPAAAAPAAPPPPPSAAATQAQRQAAPAPPAAVLRAAPVSLPWTQVRIESGGRSVVVPRMQAGELASLVTSLLASASDEAERGPAATLRLELAQGDEPAGVLELVGDRWRWTSLRETRRTRILRAEPGVAAALREEAERLLGR